MVFSVTKMVWEYGEEYGCVFAPQNLAKMKEKVEELDSWGRENNYPFLIVTEFLDQSIYLAFTVGHEYSLMEFGYDHNQENCKSKGPFYLVNQEGNPDEIIPIYYMASYTEPDTTRMLPQAKVLESVYHFVLHHQFPSFIQFDDKEVNDKFVLPSGG